MKQLDSNKLVGRKDFHLSLLRSKDKKHAKLQVKKKKNVVEAE